MQLIYDYLDRTPLNASDRSYSQSAVEPFMLLPEQVRHGRPVIFSSLREQPRAPEVTDWVRAVVRERAAA